MCHIQMSIRTVTHTCISCQEIVHGGGSGGGGGGGGGGDSDDDVRAGLLVGLLVCLSLFLMLLLSVNCYSH